MSKEIKRFIECLIPITACNLKCEYCYVIQENRRKNEIPDFKYSPEIIAKSLSQKRLGGKCYISICGAGETLIPNETLQITKLLLKEGHYINITTNGTIDKRFLELETFDKEELERLHFAFSLHYDELVRLKKLDNFIRNVKKVKELGCSFVVQINLCDSYMNNWDKIKELCQYEFGAPPQVALTRQEGKVMKIYSECGYDEYYKIGSLMKSPLFEFTMKNFMVKRKEFCYAGSWSFLLNLSTGIMTQCYNLGNGQNIMEDLDKEINFKPVGNGCACQYCINSSHFMSLGNIPELDTPTYASLRNRNEAGWYNATMNEVLSFKLCDNNLEYSKTKKSIHSIKRKIYYKLSRFKRRKGT